MADNSISSCNHDDLRRTLETGTEEDFAKISKSLLNAAKDDPAFANIAADWLYYGRYGNSKNEELAASFRQKAIEALIPDAIYDHALILEGKGNSGARTALPYYVLSAVLGDPNAIGALSEYFLYGEEFNTDYFIAGALKKHENLIRDKMRSSKKGKKNSPSR
jgi:hypothetical protein